jgi:hypothetical protein
MSAPKYRACVHRHDYNLIGSEEPVYYDTPCEKCEAEAASNETVGLSGGTVVWLIVLGVLAALGFISFVAGWWK